jgi:hypothetical protein
LHQLFTAFYQAANGNIETALRLSDACLQYDAHGAAGDPFARTLLHIKRARWREALGDLAGADAELIWTENQDLVGWPNGPAQAAEVDWVFGKYAALERQRLAQKLSAR